MLVLVGATVVASVSASVALDVVVMPVDVVVVSVAPPEAVEPLLSPGSPPQADDSTITMDAKTKRREVMARDYQPERCESAHSRRHLQSRQPAAGPRRLPRIADSKKKPLVVARAWPRPRAPIRAFVPAAAPA
ncbi:hypothetical protein OV090_00290 [Nannocystis sp. RBIL2]|uniref:hypothetical protein n=1 Tax=Nannocystis sp. RBIL2 TaxID=2996788 RepID=UPI002271C46B|nr:hypothetical protein [Nannocystis sp. RBIL2]MCY1063179.1 hypothetical protein [Nannocystis sp. RBIL2]